MATGFSVASSATENNPSSSSSASLLYKLKITLFDDQCADEEGRWRRVIVHANFNSIQFNSLFTLYKIFT